MLRRWAYPVGRGATEGASKAGAGEAEAPEAGNGRGQIDGDRSRGNKDRQTWGTKDKAARVRGKSEEQWGKRTAGSWQAAARWDGGTGPREAGRAWPFPVTKLFAYIDIGA